MANLGSASADGQIVLYQIAEKDIFESERNGRLMQMMRSMSDQSLPFNLDAWDGYPKCRDRVQDMFSDPALIQLFWLVIRIMPGRST